VRAERIYAATVISIRKHEGSWLIGPPGEELRSDDSGKEKLKGIQFVPPKSTAVATGSLRATIWTRTLALSVPHNEPGGA